MSLKQFLGSLNSFSTTNLTTEKIKFTDLSEQTSAYVKANQTPNLYGVMKLSKTLPPLNIYGSCNNLNLIGINQNRSDDAWLLFPNFSMVLYYGTNYTGLYSVLTTNNTDNIVCYANQPFYMTDYDGAQSLILSTLDDGVDHDFTSSIKVYYKGVEVTIAGLS